VVECRNAKQAYARLIGSAIFSAAGAIALTATAGHVDKLLGLLILGAGAVIFVGEWLYSCFTSDFWDEKYVVPLKQTTPKVSSGSSPERRATVEAK
jgi:hypothetical protein